MQPAVACFRAAARTLAYTTARALSSNGIFARKMAEEYRGVMGDNIQALTPIVHGVGLMAPEPTLREGDAFEFKPGMVMMLELGPPSQKPAYTWLGTPFVITEGAPRSLTKIPFEERALAVV